VGTPITPIEYGFDCPYCFAPGKTPKTIYVVFEGIVACPIIVPPYGYCTPPPNGQLFTLTQHSEGAPCDWFNQDYTDWYVDYTQSETDSRLWLNHLVPSVGVYFDSGFPLIPCQYDLANSLDCLHSNGTGGTGRVFWESSGVPEVIATKYGFVTQGTPLYDRRECGIDHQVVKLACRSDKTNILFHCDTQEFVKCTISGALSPDSTGEYFLSGVLNSQNYYQLNPVPWYLWWDGISSWFISLFIGVAGDCYWQRTDPDINGDYVPEGTASGTATVLLRKV
jgi:hypothetical protein